MVKMAFSDIMFKADVGSLFLATDPEPPYFTPDTVLQQSHGGSPSPSEKVPQFWTASPPPPNPTGYSSPGPSLPPPTTCTHPNGKGTVSHQGPIDIRLKKVTRSSSPRNKYVLCYFICNYYCC